MLKSVLFQNAAIIICNAVLLANISIAQQQGSPSATSGQNLALAANPTASFTSGDTDVAAINDGYQPRNSFDRGKGTYGNWNKSGTQWVQYEWSKPIVTNKFDVYWWNDNRGVRLPKACRVKYWDGKEFVETKNASGLGVEKDKFNTTTFDEITTPKIRLEFDSEDGYSTGILEWKVYDTGKSPKFPPTVIAGMDRVVMVGGKTYLKGNTKGMQQDGSAKVSWSKQAGPGDVSFADANDPDTTATFTAPGDYVLKLSAAEGDLTSSDVLKVKVVARPEGKQLIPVYTKKYKVDSPLWNHRIKALIVSWIPHCIEKLSDPKLREGGINNFENAAKKLKGEQAGRRVGSPWADAYLLNTVETMCVAMMIDPQGDEEIIKAQADIKAKLDEWIPIILAAQEPDGYFQTRFTLDPRVKHWDPRTRGEHEGYVAGYFLEAAIANYLMTNRQDPRLYEAAKKLADCWCDNIGPAPKKPWYDGHQEMEQALVRFGRFVEDMEGPGKGQKYIQLAKFLLDCRDGGSEYDQSHVPVIQQYEAVGHSVRAAYSYSGMSGVAMETGDIDYQSAVASLWDNIVNKKFYLTGGLGSGETSEGFGPNYSLGNQSYCESCANCGGLFFQQKMNMAYHDAKYADLYEETLFNGILGDYDMEGKNFYYQNPLDGGNLRYPWHNCPCCVGNFPRVIFMLPTWMYLKGDDGLYVNLFAGSTITVEDIAGTNVEMVQKTDYPWSGNVAITVNPKEEKQFAIKIRVPSRSVSELYTSAPEADGVTSISLNGSPISPKIEKGYAVINRTWKTGDKIDLELPMVVQRVKADERIVADRGRVALRYGPLVYNIESVDQNVDSILPAGSELSTEWKPELLNGVKVIKGTFSDGKPMLAIPHYARVNRSAAISGEQSPGGRPGSRGGRSIVWIKDQ